MMFDMDKMILPSPSASFEWRHLASGPALIARDLEPWAPHFFTSRQWLLGAGHAEMDEEAAWHDVADAAGVSDGGALVRARQVHGRSVIVASAGCKRQDADIIVTRDPNIAIAVQVADCVPLLIGDRRTGAVAAAHAGWRGMAAGVPGVTVAALAASFDSRAEDLLVALGPSIGACCYEVGTDVRDAFMQAGHRDQDIDRWFRPRPSPTPANPAMAAAHAGPRSGHWYFDGWRCVRDQLRAAGVGADRVISADLCTASHPGALCSYRRDGAPAGRLAAVIRSPLPRP